MSPILAFLLLLVLVFSVILWFLRPTKSEEAVRRQLERIGSVYSVSEDGGTILKEEVLSSMPWLNDLLYQVPGCLKLKLFITQAGSNWTVSSVLLISLVSACLASWLTSRFLAMLPVVLAVGLVAALLPVGLLYLRRQHRFRRFEELLPEAIDLMARALKAGHSLNSVIEMVGKEISAPVASEFQIVSKEQDLGLPMRDSLMNLVYRVPLDDVRFLVTAMLVQKETGGNLAEILDKTAGVMRERVRIKGQLRIYTAQGRITGWILCLLPFIVFFLISLVNPEYEKKLVSDPLGVHLLYVGLIMMALGILAIRKIISIRV